MCGFVGFTGLREGREAILHKMADRIIRIRSGKIESNEINSRVVPIDKIEW